METWTSTIIYSTFDIDSLNIFLEEHNIELEDNEITNVEFEEV